VTTFCRDDRKKAISVYVYTYSMATKTISLTEEAYQRLREMKRDEESFTDVVLRVTGSDRDVMKGFGSWADTDLREAVEAAQEEFDEDFERRQDELFGR